MPVKSITHVGQRFVILPEREYKLLRQQARDGTSKRNGQSRAAASRKPHRMTAQDRGDVAWAKKILSDPAEVSMPYATFRKRLKLD